MTDQHTPNKKTVAHHVDTWINPNEEGRHQLMNPPFLYAAPGRGHIAFVPVANELAISDGSRHVRLPIDRQGMINLATTLLLASRSITEG